MVSVRVPCQRTVVAQRRRLPSAAPRGRSGTRRHSGVSEGAARPWRIRPGVRSHLHQATRTHRLGCGNVPHEHSSKWRYEKGRSWQIPQCGLTRRDERI